MLKKILSCKPSANPMGHDVLDTIYYPKVKKNRSVNSGTFRQDRSFFFGYGRTALREGVSVSALNIDDTVLIPSLVCSAVLSSLSPLDIRIETYDVDKSLECNYYNIEETAKKGCCALLFINYFGFPQPIAPLVRLAKKYNFILIEDNAHGFMSSDKMSMLGFRGDIGIFSIRKTLSLPNGAVLLFNNDDLLEAYQKRIPIPEDNTHHSRSEEIRYLTKEAIRPVIYNLPSRTRIKILKSFQRLRDIIRGGHRVKSEMPEESGISSIAYSRLSFLDTDKECRRRRALYNTVHSLLKKYDQCLPVFEDMAEGVVPYGYPFFYNGESEKNLHNFLANYGLYCVKWPDLPSSFRERAKDYYLKLFFIPFLW